jgi:hypothetical protein
VEALWSANVEHEILSMPVSIAASASSAPWLNSFVLLTLGYGLPGTGKTAYKVICNNNYHSPETMDRFLQHNDRVRNGVEVSIAASASSAPWLNSFVLLTLGYGLPGTGTPRNAFP